MKVSGYREIKIFIQTYFFMKYYSLNKRSPLADFKEAAICGQAPDKGLYFPERIPVIEPYFFKNIENIADDEIAFRVIHPYAEGSIPDSELHRIVMETINFRIPLVQVTDTIHSLELYHGPTLAFKDVGARFMSRCLGFFSKERSEKVIVLVATSGDTGGAVANGFYGVEGVEVVILYPSGKVSLVQEKQLTTLGKNIHALEIEGSFDDCQKLVKQVFADNHLNKKLFLTSANSINVARWLPQQFYYFFAYKQWNQKDQPPVISVPSGNFGNICAGMLAHISGLPVGHFIAACNANDVVSDFLQSQNYLPKKAVATISNAMDVGDPSNFIRILELFDHQFIKIKSILRSYSISDADTRETIKDVYRSFDYLLDPHGAVGYFALQKYLEQNLGMQGIFLETAHPIKFYDVVEPVIGSTISSPESITEILTKPMKRIKMENNYQDIYQYLLQF
jgi:threonine synthase